MSETPGHPPIVLHDLPLPDHVREPLESFCTLRAWQEAASLADEVAALYTYGHPRVDGVLLKRFPSLRTISNFGVGVDHIDLEAARARRIGVGNTPGAVDGATADHAFALLLAAARNIVVGDRYARGPAFTHYDPSLLLGTDVHESTIGIIGMGRIGKRVARRAMGFEMRVLYHNRRRDTEAERDLGVVYATLEELLARADFVVLTVPLTEETCGLIGAGELRRMRPEAILVNVARGGVVDHDALVRALREGWIRAAALDVTEPEPLPRDHLLLALENVVIVPHLGSAAERSRRRMAEMAAANLRAGLEDKPLPWDATAKAEGREPRAGPRLESRSGT